LPVIFALSHANGEEAEFWRRTMAQRQQSDADLTHAIHLIEKHHAIAATLNRARTFTDEACRALNVFPDSPMRRALTDLAEFCVSRAY
jgi:octaprenyl-diphosphate synthase